MSNLLPILHKYSERIILWTGLFLHLTRTRAFFGECELLYPTITSTIFTFSILIILCKISSSWIKLFSRFRDTIQVLMYLVNIVGAFLLKDHAMNTYCVYFFSDVKINPRTFWNDDFDIIEHIPNLFSTIVATILFFIALKFYGISVSRSLKNAWWICISKLHNYAQQAVRKEDALYNPDTYNLLQLTPDIIAAAVRKRGRNVNQLGGRSGARARKRITGRRRSLSKRRKTPRGRRTRR